MKLQEKVYVVSKSYYYKRIIGNNGVVDRIFEWTRIIRSTGMRRY